MSSYQDKALQFELLRKKAEILIDRRPEAGFQIGDDIMDLIQELRVYQAEVEIQNEELRRAKQELSELHQEYVDLYYDFAPCGYVTLNRKGFITRVNLTAVTLLGLERSQLLSTPFRTVVDPESEDAYFAAMKRTRKLGKPQDVDLKLKQRENGSNRWMRADIRPDLDENDRVFQSRLTLVDISRRKQTEEELYRLNETLEKRVAERTSELKKHANLLQRLSFELFEAEERERKRIAQVLHDDLQQHLTAVKMKLQVLLSDGSEEFDKEMGAQCCDLMAEAIQKTRKLSSELNPLGLQRSGLLAGLDHLVSEMNEKYGLDVTVSCSPEAEPRTKTMRAFLYQAVRELLFNVVKHSGARKASVDARGKDDWIMIRIADSGKGGDLESLNTEGGGRTGLGLLSIEERIRFLSGRMIIETIPGNGWVTTLMVPKHGSAGESMALKSFPEKASSEISGDRRIPATATFDNPEKIRVLIADDHDLMREGLAGLLNGQKGLQVVGQAEDGREAVVLARQLNPDVILMDVSMPVLNGIEATTQIHGKTPGIGIIGLSVYDDPSIRESMMAAGAADFLCKGEAIGKIVDAVRRVCRRSRSEV